MYISSFQVHNYKSFLSSEEITLSPGFNVIVAQNNAGKTALAEALTLRFNEKCHISMKTMPSPNIYSRDFYASFVHMAFCLVEGEAEQLLRNAGDVYVSYNGKIEHFLWKLRHVPALSCIYQSGEFTDVLVETLNNEVDRESRSDAVTFLFNGGVVLRTRIEEVMSRDLYQFRLADLLRDKIYMLRAERFNMSQSSSGTSTALKSDASNLAEVLHNLQSNPGRFGRFMQEVTKFFPEIKGITVPVLEDNQGHILLWPIDLVTERQDLAIPLSESGTGIGQVLALLYILFTAEYPQTIIIDEPQSFLNPSAVRKLVEVLKHHPQHQYIIATHSPEVVSAANPQTLLLLRKEDGETVIEQLDGTKVESQKSLLLEVGARLSDVFGADNILWVEGATEETCFPFIVENIHCILEKVERKSLQGTKIVGLAHTSDFEAKYSDLVLQIYSRLSMAGGLIPPAIGIIFDGEERTDLQKNDLERRMKQLTEQGQAQGKVDFLPRRMYENYLLIPDAIAAIASSEIDSPVKSEQVEQLFNDYQKEKNQRKNKQQGNQQDNQQNNQPIWENREWLEKEHGAKILAYVFTKLSPGRIPYTSNKKYYGLKLTEWIVEHRPTKLREVAKLIADHLGIKYNSSDKENDEEVHEPSQQGSPDEEDHSQEATI